MQTRNVGFQPVMLNFVQPQVAEPINSNDYDLQYDYMKQIAFYMGGGGGGGSRNTKSQRNGRTTERRIGPGTLRHENDEPVTTDD